MLLQNSVQSTSFFYTCNVWCILICTYISRYVLALIAASCFVISSPSNPQQNLNGFAWLSGFLNILFCSWMLKEQWYKWPLMELKASDRFVRDALLRVSFSNLGSWKVVHFVLVETAFTKYGVSSNKHPLLGTY